MGNITVSVLTVSDRSSRKEREDTSGPKLINRIGQLGWEFIDYEIVPDQSERIQEILLNWSENQRPNIILTTGGTGFSPRDITPEATLAIVEKLTPGLSEKMRADGLSITPHAMLSRGVSGIKNSTLIVNLPGSPKAALENLAAIESVLPHAIKLILHKPEAEKEH